MNVVGDILLKSLLQPKSKDPKAQTELIRDPWQITATYEEVQTREAHP
jgi:hypothetical protein